MILAPSVVGLEIRGRRVTPLWLRVPMQALFMLWAWYIK